MNILWVSPFLPQADAPHAGGRAMARWVEAVAARHDLTLLLRIEPRDRPAAEAWRARVAGLHLLTFRRPPPGPLQMARIAASYVRLGRMANRLVAAGGVDVLHVEYLETGIAIDARLPVPRLVVAIDELGKPARHRFAIARGPGRLGAWLYAAVIERLERRICRRFDRVLVLSEHDQRALLALDPSLSVGVLPFPINVDAARAGDGPREPDLLLFVGAMYRDVNVDAMRWFCAEVLPRVRVAVPGARLAIVGGGPGEEVRRLGRLPGVTVTGFVETLEPWYGRAAAVVAPLRVAGGIASKIVDAMASGCAVVTTPIGNEGLGATPGDHLLVADEPAAFAQAVVRVLTNEPTRRRLGEAARAFALERFSFEASIGTLEDEHRCLAGTTLTRRSGA
jgi:glycosyltransferase involved in cell wall biosynthesis